MKKFVKVLALVMVVALCASFLASCGGPNADPAKEKEKLEKKEFAVVEDKLVIPTALKLLGVNTRSVMTAANNDGASVTIIYFEDKAAANDAWDTVKEYAEKNKKDSDSDWSIKKSGAVIYFGNSAGCKAL